MNKPNNYDDDDLRNRRYIDLRPDFYLKAVYDPASDQYNIRPFIYVNTGDGQRSDFVECPVKERHIVQYREEYERFQAESALPRSVYTRDELMRLPDYADKYEYNRRTVGLMPDNPEYQRTISDFSIKLRQTDLYALRRLDGVESVSPRAEPAPAAVKQESVNTNDAILVVLRDLVGQMRDLNTRVATIENKQKE